MKPARATQYPDRELQAARSVLIELGVLLKDVQDRIVLIGGFVPWLTLEGEPPHVGTLDVDLNFDLEAFAALEASSVIARLERAGYERGTVPRMPFRLRRWVAQGETDGLKLEPISVSVDLLAPQTFGGDTVEAWNDPSIGLPMQGAIGSHLALRSNRTITLDGITPTGERHTVTWRVASLAALLVMKGHAMSDARAKDAYDIYYVLRHAERKSLIESCRALANDPVAATAFARIATHFRADDDLGPQWVASFLLDSSALGDSTEEQVMQEAFQRVKAWVNALGL